jgi:hypothetical protein
MCYAIAALQLLFSLPKFSKCFVKKPDLKVKNKADEDTFNALLYLAKCSLHKESPDKYMSRHSGAIFKNIAQRHCRLTDDTEHDPAEFMSKFIECLTRISAAAPASFKIDRDMFETEIVADSVMCQE